MLCAFGELYHKLCVRIIKNIRDFDKKRKICILTENFDYFTNIDDGLIIKYFDYRNHTHPNIDINNNWNKYGLIPKIYQYLYSPFDTTMFFDVDMIFYKDFTFAWEHFKSENKLVLMCGRSDDNNRSPSGWHWGAIDNVMYRCGFNCPQICGTLLMYNKDFRKNVHDSGMLNYILDNIKNWGVRSLYNDGYPDEIISSLMLGLLNIRPSKILNDWVHDPSNLNACDKEI